MTEDLLTESEEEEDVSYEAEEELAFQREQYMYVMGQEERKVQQDKADQQQAAQEREAQANYRREMRRKEEEERLVVLGKRNVLLIIWEGFEEIMAVTMIDCLRAADVNVVVAAVNPKGTGRYCQPVMSARGCHSITVVADVSFETTCNSNFHLFNAIVIPGGENLDALSKHTKLVSLVKTMCYKEKFIGGASQVPATIFARAGVMKGRCVTGSPELAEVTKRHCKSFCSDEGVFVDYNLITCKGVSDSIEFALTVVKCIFADEQHAVQVAMKMNYDAYVKRVEERKAMEQAAEEAAAREAAAQAEEVAAAENGGEEGAEGETRPEGEEGEDRVEGGEEGGEEGTRLGGGEEEREEGPSKKRLGEEEEDNENGAAAGGDNRAAGGSEGEACAGLGNDEGGGAVGEVEGANNPVEEERAESGDGDKTQVLGTDGAKTNADSAKATRDGAVDEDTPEGIPKPAGRRGRRGKRRQAS